MKNTTDQPWIEAGYSLFSKEGVAGLKIEHIARAVGISRSSFYHHFADMEIFEEKLLEYHFFRAKRASAKVKLCKAIEPDFLLLMVDEKEYILFNRQLRVNRQVPEYKNSFESAISLMANESMDIWSEMLGLQQKQDVARRCFSITAEILFHRMTVENMNYEWLKLFLDEIKVFLKEVDGINIKNK